MQKKCIVLGANGYIGRHLIYFLKDNFDVFACDIQEKGAIDSVNYTSIDISDKQQVNRLDWHVDFVFMFAGLTGTYNGFDTFEKFNSINEIGLLNVLDSIKQSKYKPKVIFPSTRLVYKGSENALKEEDLQEAKTIYAVNKIACEHILQAYSTSFDINYTIYRICVPYGNVIGSDYSYGTIGFFLNQAQKNGEISLYGDGSLRRTFTHVVDVCNQIIASCGEKASNNQTYNIIGEDYSLKECASFVAQKYNATVKFTAWPEKDLKIESGSTVFDSRKLQQAFNLELKYTFKNWLENI